MRLGICVSERDLEAVAEAGAEYIECTVVSVNEMTDDVLKRFSMRLRENGLRCEAMNVLFPGDIRLVGEDADMNAISAYTEKTFARIAALSPDVVVFGSGGARRRPDGFSYEKAYGQLVTVGRQLAREAEKYGLTVALEPLNTRETNMVVSLAEAYGLCKQVDHPHFKLTADFYHMLMNGEPAGDITVCGEYIAHVHFAAIPERECPAPEDKAMFEDYFKALITAGYDGRVSIEGKTEDYARQIPLARKLLAMYS